MSNVAVDFVPAKHQSGNDEDHTLYVRLRAARAALLYVIKQMSPDLCGTLRRSSDLRPSHMLARGALQCRSCSPLPPPSR